MHCVSSMLSFTCASHAVNRAEHRHHVSADALRYSLEVDPLASHSSTFTTLLSSLLSSYHLSLASLPHIISDLSHSLNSDKSAMFNVEHHYSAIPVKAVMESVLEGVREVLEDVNAMVYEASPLGKVVGPEMADIKSAGEPVTLKG